MLDDSEMKEGPGNSIQDIKQAVSEPPQEEEDGNQANGDDGLLESDLGSSRDLFVADALPLL